MLYPGIIFAIDVEGKARRAFVQGGFAEITNTHITILTQEALAFDEVTPELIDQEILRLQMGRDATSDGILRARADAAISRLEELKGNLRLAP
jgi:F-type H+-transporting ATPase subunit epsilon